MTGALCAQIGGDEWFPDPGHSTTRARAVCRRCPVREACLELALANDERHGIFVGTTPAERRAILRERAA